MARRLSRAAVLTPNAVSIRTTAPCQDERLVISAATDRREARRLHATASSQQLRLVAHLRPAPTRVPQRPVILKRLACDDAAGNVSADLCGGESSWASTWPRRGLDPIPEGGPIGRMPVDPRRPVVAPVPAEVFLRSRGGLTPRSASRGGPTASSLLSMTATSRPASVTSGQRSRPASNERRPTGARTAGWPGSPSRFDSRRRLALADRRGQDARLSRRAISHRAGRETASALRPHDPAPRPADAPRWKSAPPLEVQVAEQTKISGSPGGRSRPL